MVEVHGEVASGFEAVKDAFAANFEQHDEVGAAISLYRHGEKVVDLWGGVADVDSGTPWAEDTLQLVFSTTKGATAIAALIAMQEGDLDLDAKVASYWPSFEAEGKGEIPVRWLLSHRSGLPVVDDPPPAAEVLRWDPICDALARQKPIWEPGTKHGYHALTYGWLVGEVIRRATGRDIGAYFAEKVAAPLGLDFFIGLPASEERRVSKLIQLERPAAGELDVSSLPEEMRAIAEAFLDPNSTSNRALNITDPPLDWNDEAVHAAQIPAANGITTARSLARMYAATIGEVDGVRLLTPETVEAACEVQSEGPDEVLFIPTKIGLGFWLHSMFMPLLNDGAFGHAGAGGSLGFADPSTGVAFGYVMNKMQQNLAGDPRSIGLVEAVRKSL